MLGDRAEGVAKAAGVTGRVCDTKAVGVAEWIWYVATATGVWNDCRKAVEGCSEVALESTVAAMGLTFTLHLDTTHCHEAPTRLNVVVLITTRD